MLCMKKLKIKLDFLKELNKYIEYNDKALIAEKLGVSRQMISEFLSGKSPSNPTAKGVVNYLLENGKIDQECANSFVVKIDKIYKQKIVKAV